MKKIKLFSISMTTLWTIAFGSALHDWTLGIALGIMMGVVFGLFNADKNNETEEHNGAEEKYENDDPPGI